MRITFSVLFFSVVLCAGQSQAQKTAGWRRRVCSAAGRLRSVFAGQATGGQGITPFRITTKSPEAQKFFDQGVAQMHSFWAREAERSFLQAAQLDPEAPMPYWGVAMVARRLSSTLPVGRRAVEWTSNTSREAGCGEGSGVVGCAGQSDGSRKMYIAAIAARRDEKAKDKDEAFVKGLRALLAKYPNEVEARSYLALMIMRGFVLPEKKPRYRDIDGSRRDLRQLMQDAPDHPGVHHYVIHGFEGSSFAKDAWPSCKRYAELVTNIPHALHMPGQSGHRRAVGTML